MSKKDILEWFAVNSASLSVSKILLLLLAGMVIGAVIFITYQITYQGVSYSYKFNCSNVVILLITVVIMLMISSNIVISLGMVGALSIVRFRTAVKDSRDTVFIFWSIVEGLCVGSQNLKLSFLSTLMIAVVLVALSFVKKGKDNYLLIIRTSGEKIPEEEMEAIIQNYVKKFKLKNVNRTAGASELIYELHAKGTLNTRIVEELQGLEEVTTVNWLLQTGEMAG